VGNQNFPLDITYEKRKAIKLQILPDFTVEWLELQNIGPRDLSSVRMMYFDGPKECKVQEQDRY
jgi:hypothetical protein